MGVRPPGKSLRTWQDVEVLGQGILGVLKQHGG